MTLADDWYDEWLTRVQRKHAYDRHYRRKLQAEREAVERDVAAHGETAYDAQTESLRRTLHADLRVPA